MKFFNVPTAACWLVAAGVLTTTTTAFVPTARTRANLPMSRTTARGLTPDALPDLLPSALESWQLLSSSSSSPWWLADAAAAAVETAKDDPGWWENFINIFKIGLEAIHSTLDPPLRSIGITQTWGITIAVFTALCRLVLVPVSIQQSQSAEYMKVLRPYTKDIRERYKDNQDAQNRAIGKLYEDARQNPLAGCLASLAQLPIFLGLYRGVRLLAVDGELQEPFLFIPSLEGPVSAPDYRGLDWLIAGWTPAAADGGFALPTPALGWETTLAFLVMPVVLVLLQSVTMSVLQPPLDDSMGEEERKTVEQSQKIFKFLPLMIGFFSVQVPAGLTIYWLTSNIFTLTQTLAVKAYFAANPPKIELPDYWDSALEKKDFKDMSPTERREAIQAGIKIGPSMEDLVDEARFHVHIPRRAFRTETAAWQRAVMTAAGSMNKQGVMAPELAPWVAAAAPASTHQQHQQQQLEAAAVATSPNTTEVPYYARS